MAVALLSRFNLRGVSSGLCHVAAKILFGVVLGTAPNKHPGRAGGNAPAQDAQPARRTRKAA